MRWFTGVPSPVRHPELVDMVIFRENTEDVYAGHRARGGHRRGQAAHRASCHDDLGWDDPRADSGIGIKPISPMRSKRLIRAAIQYALDHERRA